MKHRFFCWPGASLALLGCAAHAPVPAHVPPVPRAELATSVFLIGDAGAPDPDGEPVLWALRRDLANAPEQRIVVFLGDNIYPRGLPRPEDPDRSEAERRLRAQIEVVTTTRARGVFVLGNHDWARHGPDGWAAARRQTQYVDSVSRGLAAVRPVDGCPGPTVEDIGPRLRLVLLDTQWWLHPGPKPDDLQSTCPTNAEEEIVAALRTSLLESGDRVVVAAAHHPLTTGGVHGGYFGWKDHLFPLRLVLPGLWLPLPLIGSLYPAARQNGISSQDLTSPAYGRLIDAFRRAFADRPPALYAAGHEHNLQVIERSPASLEVVSGGGIYGHTGRAVPVRGTLFARNASGYARLDIPVTGPPRLAVVEVAAHGGSNEVFSIRME
ncbi:MAG TPA: metallophosphoesterase [Gemmatimonadales bacterium]|nr:metallophosphoesterase [Gemmatimonadales bacterium]